MNPMTRALGIVTASAVIAIGASLFAQSVPEIAYDANADLLTPPSFGEFAGIATDSKGQIYVYERTGNPVATLGGERTFFQAGSRLLVFDRSGKFVREIGQGFYTFNVAQQVRIDPQDNIWLVDAGSMTVVKFDPNGRFLLSLGRKPESIGVRPGAGTLARAIDIESAAAEAGRGAEGGRGAAAAGGRGGAPEAGRGGGAEGGRGGGAATGAGNPSDIFDRPADVTWDRSGNIYVADGFGTNNRIAKFAPNGNYLKSWGQTGSGQGQFNGIRGMVSDAAGNIYVADAGNKRIQVFDGEGTFKSQITNIGTPRAICISSGATQYLFSSNSNDPESMDNGEIYKLQLNGQAVGKFGKAGKLSREFGMVNAIDCRNDSEVWLAEVWNWRAQKVTLKR